MSKEYDNVTAIPTIDQIYQLRASIDTLSLEIDTDQKTYELQLAEKRGQLHNLRAELSTLIRQVNEALQQLKVPVISEAAPEPIPIPAPTLVPDNDIRSPEPAPVIRRKECKGMSLLAYFYVVAVTVFLAFVLVHYFVHRFDPSPPTPPGPTPIVVTEVDRIIQEVKMNSALTHKEKIVEATQRLVQELGMERDAAYKTALDKLPYSAEELFGPQTQNDDEFIDRFFEKWFPATLEGPESAWAISPPPGTPDLKKKRMRSPQPGIVA